MHEKILPDINLENIPVEALRPRTLGKLSCMLNGHKILLSPEPERLLRDYRGIAHLMGISLIEGWLGENPIEKLLTVLGPGKNLTLGQLQSYFALIDRYDVLDDTKQMFHDDAVEFETKRTSLVQRQPSPNTFSNNSDANILTIDDIIRNQKGHEGPQFYDVFILYTDEDRTFAEDIRNKMETDLKLKVCDKDRDLAPGVTFQHAAIMQLISERCNWLFVILSDEFLRSDRHTFFVKFGQAITYQRGHKKVIPCTYKKCTLPIEYSSYVRADYANDYFWRNLQHCLLPIKNVEERKTDQDESTGVRIEEITLEDKDPVLPKDTNRAKNTDGKTQSITKRIRRALTSVKTKNKKSKTKEIAYAS